MPNLESIEIKSTARSSVGVNWRAERPEWPALKQLHVTVDSKKSRHTLVGHIGPQVMSTPVTYETKALFQFLFQDVRRPELVNLWLEFTKDAEHVAVPKTREIVEACPKLKRLTIVNWPGTNKAISELFGGLMGLEEICLAKCTSLGNVAFVGEDTRRPVFFKSKKLRKLSLKGLDRMTKITDLLFTIIIRHLNLTHFTLTSESPVKSVTASGIRLLLDGEFAQCVKKFRPGH